MGAGSAADGVVGAAIAGVIGVAAGILSAGGAGVVDAVTAGSECFRCPSSCSELSQLPFEGPLSSLLG